MFFSSVPYLWYRYIGLHVDEPIYTDRGERIVEEYREYVAILIAWWQTMCGRSQVEDEFDLAWRWVAREILRFKIPAEGRFVALFPAP